jgi:hypothetical protein
MAATTTHDPDVVIETDELLADTVDPVQGGLGTRAITYRSLSTGRRWQVIGNCDHRGDCLVGSVIGGFSVTSKADFESETFKHVAATISAFDTPVTPEFTDCCPFDYVELLPQ